MAGAAHIVEDRRHVLKRVRAGRIALILVAIGFLALLLVAPLAMILIQALAKGLSAPVVSRLFRLGLFWHFLDIVWIGIFSVVYLPGMV